MQLLYNFVLRLCEYKSVTFILIRQLQDKLVKNIEA
jgi:hypothetical protein